MPEGAELLDLLAATATLCRAALADNGPLIVALFLGGLGGGVTHCAGMCGPFVLAQVTAGGESEPVGGGEVRRLGGALLLPYHAGRATTYAGLGALAAAVTAGATGITGFSGIAAGLLLLAAALFLLNGLARVRRRLPAAPAAGLLASLLARMAAPFLAAPGGTRGYLLGLLLGFLPCGLLYGALAAAAAADGPLGGAFAMLAFTAGTVPALVGAGFLGHFFARRLPVAARAFSGVLMVVNAGLLCVLAWRLASGPA